MNKKLSSVVLSIAALLLPSCRQIECGPGTLEVDGVCMANGDEQMPNCGQGFYWDSVSGTCRSGAFDDAGVGICDPETTTPVVDDQGVVHCVGTGGVNCDVFLPCLAPTQQNRISICGRIYDTETSEPLDDGDETNGEPYLDIEVRIYEPLGFVGNPNAVPFAMGQVDSCGRFKAENIPWQASGYAAVAIEDASGSGADTYMLTGVAESTPQASLIADFKAFATRNDTVDGWDASANRTGTDRFRVKGVYLPIFLDPNDEPHTEPFEGAAQAGVQVTEGTTVIPSNDFYFSDTDPRLRTTIDVSLNETGANGSALMIDTGLGNHSGTGNEPDGCEWPSTLSAAVPGVVFLQERLPSVETGECN
jgi:hypothetical protein